MKNERSLNIRQLLDSFSSPDTLDVVFRNRTGRKAAIKAIMSGLKRLSNGCLLGAPAFPAKGFWIFVNRGTASEVRAYMKYKME
jgi:hypothetical protein